MRMKHLLDVLQNFELLARVIDLADVEAHAYIRLIDVRSGCAADFRV